MDTQNIKTTVGLGRRGSLLLTTLSGQGKIIFTAQEAHQVACFLPVSLDRARAPAFGPEGYC